MNRRLPGFSLPFAIVIAVVSACSSSPPAATTRVTPAASTPAAATPAAATAAATTPDPGPSEALDVSSASGNATLSIPEGALPAGLDPASVSIAETELDERFADTPVIAAIELEPTGTTFSEPAFLTLDVDEPVVATLVLVSGDSIELVDTTTSVDEETGQATLSAEISHFSSATFIERGIDADLQAPETAGVGQSFVVTATVTQGPLDIGDSADESTGTDGQKAAARALNALFEGEPFFPATFESGGFTASSIFQPTETTIDAREEPIEDSPMVVEQEFLCREKGPGFITFFGHVSQKLKTSDVITGSNERKSEFSNHVVVNCQEAPPTPAVEVIDELPEGDISGQKWVYNENPLGLLFTLYWYGFDITHITVFFEGDNPTTTEILFNPNAPGFENIPFPVDAPGPVKIKKVIVTKADGSQADITKPFVDQLGTDTIDVGGDSCVGSIC